MKHLLFFLMSLFVVSSIWAQSPYDYEDVNNMYGRNARFEVVAEMNSNTNPPTPSLFGYIQLQTPSTDPLRRKNNNEFFNKEVHFNINRIVTNNLQNIPYVLANNGFEINFDDGNGFVPISSSQIKVINYPSVGTKTLTLRATFKDPNNSGNVISDTWTYQIIIRYNQGHTYQSPDEILDLETPVYTSTCSNVYDASSEFAAPSKGYAKAYIKYANPSLKKFTKPFILVEGIDVNREVAQYDPNYTPSGNSIPSNTDRIIRYGSVGWDVFMHGILPSTAKVQRFAQMPNMLNDLIAQGYDIIYLDFKNPVDYIQKNAILVQKLIEHVNANKACGSDDIVILGASMGGQNVRYALTKMEQNGIEHHVRTYVSFDSPHQGASVPMSVQSAVFSLAYLNPDTSPSNQNSIKEAKKLWNFLTSPAAQQMLYEGLLGSIKNGQIQEKIIQHDFLNFNTDFTKILYQQTLRHIPSYTNMTLDFDCLRSSYINEINSLGYPDTRNIAVINGSKNGTNQGFGQGGYLVNAEVVELGFSWFNMHLKAAPSSTLGNTRLPGNFQYMSVIKKELPLKLLEFDIDGANLNPYDNVPGCSQNYSELLMDKIGANPAITNISGVDDHSFMPSISTLDLNTSNMYINIQQAWDAQTIQSPFVDWFAPNENEVHVEITVDNRTWLANQVKLNDREIPSVLTGTYNLAGERTVINGTIANGGKWYVNNNSLPTGLPTSSNLAPTDKHTAYINQCGLTVENGGLFVVGSGNWDERADVIIKAGSKLHVKNGGQVIIKGYSRIIVEEGADFVIEEGAKVNYWKAGQNEARIIVKGNLEVVKTSSTLPALFSGGGRLVLEKDGQVKMISNGTFLKISGPVGNQDPILELKDNLSIDGNNKKLEIKDGKVQYHDGGLLSVNVGAKLLTDRVYFKGGATPSPAIKGYGTNILQVVRSDFDGFSYAIQLANCYGSASYPYYISASTFSNSDGIKLENVNRFRISNSYLDGTPNMIAGIDAKNVTLLDIIHCDFENFGFGLYLDNVASCKIRGGEIKDNSWGIFDNANSYVRMYDGTLVQNNTTAIEMTGGVQGSTVSMNCVTFDGNVNGIIGTDITLDIDPILNNGGSNIFQNISPTGKLFDICYQNVSLSNISMTYNYWDGLATLPTSYYSLTNTFRGLCSSPITTDFSNALTTLPSECAPVNVAQTDPQGGMITPSNGNQPTGISLNENKEQGLTASTNDFSELSINASIYPNPMTASATLQYNVATDAEVNIRLMNTLGQVVRVLKSERMTTGEYQLAIDREDLNTGMYFCELTFDSQKKVIKFVVN